MPLRSRIAPLALVLTLTPPVVAETIYRWIAPDGSVSFSTTPPPDREAEAMQFAEPAPLTPEELEARRERVRLMQELAAQMEEERRARESAALVRRLPPPPPPAAATSPPPAEPAQEPVDEGALEFDDWWTGPARPVPLSPPVVSESSGGGDHRDFQPNTTPTPSFH
jgi:hypothetical protein